MCGIGRWAEAAGASLVVVLANTVLRQVAQLLNLKMGVNDNLSSQVNFDLTCLPQDAAKVRKDVERMLREAEIDIRALGQTATATEATVHVSVSLEHGDLVQHTDALLDQLGAMKVTGVSWSHA